MDPASQGLLGATAVQAVFARKKIPLLWLIGIIAAIAADLDIFIQSNTNPLLFIHYHRHFTHAFTFIIPGGLFIASLFLLFYKPLRSKWSYVIGAAILAYATHGILDACTSYGTVLFWPFSERRIAFDIISIVDPTFTAILFIGFMVSVYHDKTYPAIIALCLCCLYLGFGAYQHHNALNIQRLLAEKRGDVITKGRVMPTLGNVFIWRSIYRHRKEIVLDTITLSFFHSAQTTYNTTLIHFKKSDLPKAIQGSQSLLRDFNVFDWFADDFIAAFSKKPLKLVDLRYLIRRNKHVTALWGIEFPKDKERKHVYWRQNIPYDVT